MSYLEAAKIVADVSLRRRKREDSFFEINIGLGQKRKFLVHESRLGGLTFENNGHGVMVSLTLTGRSYEETQ